MPDGWWTISAEAFLNALRRVEAGETADIVYAEYYAQSQVTQEGFTAVDGKPQDGNVNLAWDWKEPPE